MKANLEDSNSEDGYIKICTEVKFHSSIFNEVSSPEKGI